MATIKESSLVLSLLDRFSSPAKGIYSTIQKLEGAAARNAASLAAMRGKMVEAAAAGFALYHALNAPLDAAMKFETQLEDIGQKADVGRDKLGALGKQLQAIGKLTNQSGSSIAGGNGYPCWPRRQRQRRSRHAPGNCQDSIRLQRVDD